jgi:hypothetical protein
MAPSIAGLARGASHLKIANRQILNVNNLKLA